MATRTEADTLVIGAGSAGCTLAARLSCRDRRRVAVVTGFFDVPNRLGLPGEEPPRVVHYYREPYPYTGQRVAVIGGKNSAVKAALDCYRHGAEVTLIHRGADRLQASPAGARPCDLA